MPSGGANKKLSPELMERIVDLFCEGKTRIQIASEVGCGVSTIHRWRLEDVRFDEKCSRAEELAVELELDALEDIAKNEPDVQRARLICDNRKWKASKRYVRKYGDRIDLNVNQTVDISGALNEALNRKLLPMRDPEKLVESEVIVMNSETLSNASDGKSEVQNQIDPIESDDIFS